jgi:hypothetical protein
MVTGGHLREWKVGGEEPNTGARLLAMNQYAFFLALNLAALA